MSLLSLPMEISDARIDSRYRLVIAAAQRARQLVEGNRPRIESRYVKETTCALEEISSGQADILFGQEARKAIIEERRQRDALRSRTRMAAWEGVPPETARQNTESPRRTT